MFLLVYNSFILQISGGTKTNWIVLVNFSVNRMEPGKHKNTDKLNISYYKSEKKNVLKYGIKIFFLIKVIAYITTELKFKTCKGVGKIC